MIHSEPNPNRMHIVLLGICAALLFFLFLGVRELSPAEAAPALTAQQAVKTGAGLTEIIERLGLQIYPLPARLVQLASGIMGGVHEWSLRLPGALAILAMGVLAAAGARCLYGWHAAAITFAATCISIPGVQAARAGAGAGISALFLAMAWFGWFIFGWQRQRWFFAWWGSLLLVLLAAFGQGYLAFLYFYLPLLFLRRPLRAWTQLASLTHFLPLAVSLSLFTAWYFWLHDTMLPIAYAETAFGIWPSPTPYIARLFTFPLQCGLLLIPWVFFLWPAYCTAFGRLERHGPFMQFLRSLILPVFLMAWIVPTFKPGHLLPLLAPVAVLCGAHYDILIRRHKTEFQKLARLIAVVTLVPALIALLITGLHISQILVIEGLSKSTAWAGFCCALSGAALLAAFFKSQPRMPIWLQTSTAAALLGFFLIAGWLPPWAALQNQARYTGRKLAGKIPENGPVYNLANAPSPAIAFYINRTLRSVTSPDDLPAGKEVIYVIGGGQPPLQETRVWEPLSPHLARNGCAALRLQSGKEAGAPAKLSNPCIPPEDAASQDLLRSYKGQARNLTAPNAPGDDTGTEEQE